MFPKTTEYHLNTIPMHVVAFGLIYTHLLWLKYRSQSFYMFVSYVKALKLYFILFNICGLVHRWLYGASTKYQYQHQR